MKKKVDARIRTLIENGIKTKHRSVLVLVGDHGKDQSQVKARPSVLWCYKKELGFTTHRKKRIKQIKKMVQRGLRDADTDDPFELFISTTDIRWTYYKESHKILGNTYGMLVLQDFEALTPNLLARTVETVEGGGLIIFLLKTMSSLKQLYTMTMDAHARFRTESAQDVVGRFNERFILSLGNCDNCLVLDDELNMLPISSRFLDVTPIDRDAAQEITQDARLKELKESTKDMEPVGALVREARTVDQAKAILTFIEGISEKSLRSTVTLTAARGRGKSAALGLAIAAAVSFGYSNIFVTSPSPENLKTLFEFLVRGLTALGMKEQQDYQLIESTNPEFNHAIVRVNVFRSHRQTVQYIQPQDSQKLVQAELVVIDEAAAIPLPVVRSLLGPYLVFMASTINGYEGTGRSLSLKLIEQLRQQSANKAAGARVLREVELKDPIRYSAGDPIEKWLNELLCLDATAVPRLPSGYPHPNDCELYYVNRDTLFSYHKASETFLQRMVSLFVSSHYKNSPDDLLLMSDAPAHHLFVLLGPVDELQKQLPEILCAVQVCLEGRISRQSVVSAISQGRAGAGDLIPWTIAQQFQDNDFPSLSGCRVVRIATHPEYQRMGYGARALQLLTSYYQGEFTSLEEGHPAEPQAPQPVEESGPGLAQEQLRPRKNLPPLLLQLKDRGAERLHYMGVSFGVTPALYAFWRKAGYVPVYLRQTANELTGEHTCIMLKQLHADDAEVSVAEDWLPLFYKDFRRRMLSLLGYAFRTFPASLALSVLHVQQQSAEEGEAKEGEEGQAPKEAQSSGKKRKHSEGAHADREAWEAVADVRIDSKAELYRLVSPYDLKRLTSYAHNLLDYHVIVDLLPALARAFFMHRVPDMHLSAGQSAILLALGLQHKSVDEISTELTLPVNQVLALFNKSIRKFTQFARGIQEKAAAATLPAQKTVRAESLEKSLRDELREGAAGAKKAWDEKVRAAVEEASGEEGEEEDEEEDEVEGGEEGEEEEEVEEDGDLAGADDSAEVVGEDQAVEAQEEEEAWRTKVKKPKKEKGEQSGGSKQLLSGTSLQGFALGKAQQKSLEAALRESVPAGHTPASISIPKAAPSTVAETTATPGKKQGQKRQADDSSPPQHHKRDKAHKKHKHKQ